MSVADYLAIAALLISVAGLIYREGAARERQQQLEERTKAWADGLGKLVREIRGKDERRWKFQIIACVEASETLEQAKRFVNQLREDAFRDD